MNVYRVVVKGVIVITLLHRRRRLRFILFYVHLFVLSNCSILKYINEIPCFSD